MYRGFFLNLARNEQRRTSLTRHLAAIGALARYRRVEAVDGRAVAPAYETRLDPGNLGLWLTHERVLREHGAADAHLHLLEDDAVLARGAVGIFEDLLRQADERLGGWDLLFTDVLVPLNDPDVFRLFAKEAAAHTQARTFSVVNLARIDFACTSSVFINKASAGKYAGLIAGRWAAGLPIDLYIRGLVRRGELKAYVTVPFVTSVSPDGLASDIRGRVDRSRRVCELVRRAFFLEADLGALLAEMRDLTRGARLSPLASLYLEAESFTLSDQWVPF
jgi:hypothetical protein